MSLLADFVRVTPGRPCPICARRKYCLVDRASATDPARVICTKVESKIQWGEAGWLHVLRDDGRRNPDAPRVRRVVIDGSRSRFGDLAGGFQSAAAPSAIAGIARGLGLAPGSLARLGIGWADRESLLQLGTSCRGRGCWTFPMMDAAASVVGIRLRTEDGFKYAIAGGKQGLFIPTGLDTPDRLFVAEGATDTAALLDLGFAAVGRPSCNSGARILVGLVNSLRPSEIVIVGDGDEPGIRGAESLTAVLRAYVRIVRTIYPPDGIKDVRAWKNSSSDTRAVKADLEAAIRAAAPRLVSITSRERRR